MERTDRSVHGDSAADRAAGGDHEKQCPSFRNRPIESGIAYSVLRERSIRSTPEGWDHFLATQHFTQESFRQYWQQRSAVLSFVEQRFRSGIRPDPNMVATYYRETFLPRFERSHATAPPLSAVADQIGDILIEQDISSLLSDWLKTLRAQSTIVVFQAGKEQR